MPIATRSWPLSSVLLALAGLTLVGAGLYFLFLRPPLLREDIRYMGLSAAQLDAVRPRLEAWLTHVFLVMGGYVLETSVLIVTLAATSFRTHHCCEANDALTAITLNAYCRARFARRSSPHVARERLDRR